MADKRENIAAVADRVFYEEGFSKTGIDRIVAEAGVALGTLYHHFGNKSGLVVGALRHREAAYFKALDAAAEGKSGEDRILSLFNGLLAWTSSKGGNGCFFLRAAADNPDDVPVREAAMSHKHAFLRLIERRLVESGRSAAAARRLAPVLYVLLEGAVAACPVLGDEVAIKGARDAAKELLGKEAVRRGRSASR
jgi:AcrR family transcriptional regulator